MKKTKKVEKFDALDCSKFQAIPSAQLLQLKAGSIIIIDSDVI